MSHFKHCTGTYSILSSISSSACRWEKACPFFKGLSIICILGLSHLIVLQNQIEVAFLLRAGPCRQTFLPRSRKKDHRKLWPRDACVSLGLIKRSCGSSFDHTSGNESQWAFLLFARVKIDLRFTGLLCLEVLLCDELLLNIIFVSVVLNRQMECHCENENAGNAVPGETDSL